MRPVAANLPAVVLALVATGCGHGDRLPAFLMNESAVTLAVFVSMQRRDAPTGHFAKCRLERDREPLIHGSVAQAHEQKYRAWPTVDLTTFDAAACDARFSIPADTAVLMFWSPRHGDESDVPFIDRLEIAGADGRAIRLTAPAADAAFAPIDRHRIRAFVVR